MAMIFLPETAFPAKNGPIGEVKIELRKTPLSKLWSFYLELAAALVRQ